MMLGLDYAGGRPSPAMITAAGYGFVVRYLSDGGPNLPGKLLTPGEADALRAAGVEIVSNWETTADRMLGGYAAGEYDATLALAQVRACGGRDDRPIYFSADFDATEEQQALINDYLRGAASVLGVENVGIYGGYWPVSRALDAGVARWAWQTDAWSGDLRDPRIHLHQRIRQVDVDGVRCDINEALAADYGQWSGGIEPVSYDTEQDTVSDTELLGDIREQLCGSQARETGYPGWSQLGQNPDGTHRTVVDGVAAALAGIAALQTTVAQLATKLGIQVPQ
ncbi:DUF1906 domain-containing protein [Nocardia sp. NPDC051911]|uniref:DUF1906 domain-containing protein n=1 Tax=Nocardia sp. NPDC051911 TaxID=3154648 RepID=UPI00342CD88D